MVDKKEILKNEKGIIAETYSELQSIPTLERAKNAFPTEKASYISSFKAILQAFEIGILNITDLLKRISIDLDNDKLGQAVIKVGWSKDFNFLLNQVSNSLFLLNTFSVERFKQLDLAKISSINQFYEVFRHFDSRIFVYLKTHKVDLKDVIGNQSFDNNLTELIHYIRVSNFEITTWGNNLSKTFSPLEIKNYEEFIGANYLEESVNAVLLEGDTFFTQFRGLHQIPEILTAEINDHIENATKFLRERNIKLSVYHLQLANILTTIVLASLPPIINNLSTFDYHQIRENLGLTSGSHSVAIHYHLFRDLYQQLGKEFVKQYFVTQSDYLNLTSSDFLIKTLESEVLELSNFTLRWRNFHIHLPRNNVGGNFTKSLIGSSDAIEAVKKMKSSAENSDPLKPIKEIYEAYNSKNRLTFESYINSDDSLDALLLKTTGEITQNRFASVQNRTGVFSKSIPFVPPIKRQT